MKTFATITGLAVGDALGAPFEHYRTEQIERLNWDGQYFMPDHHLLNIGQWTDDTQLAMSLAQSITNSAEYDPVKVSQNYLKLYKTGNIRGIGRQTINAFTALESGKSWNESGKITFINLDPDNTTIKIAKPKFGNMCGNGTIMRIAPLGLFYRKDFAKLLEFARKDAVITHDHIDAKDGNVAVANIIACVANGNKPLEAVKETIPLVSSVGNIRTALEEAERLAFQSKSWKDAISLGIEGTAHQTLASAVFCALRYCDDGFSTAVISAIRMGGDTDTRAAIVGAIMGTYLGLEKIPDVYLDDLEHVDYLNALDKVLSVGPDELQRLKAAQ